MSGAGTLILRSVEVDGVRTDVSIADGVVAEIAPTTTRGAMEIEGGGGALIPGLIDHHIHLFATAARLASVDLAGARSKDDLILALRAADEDVPPDVWIRAVNYDDSLMGLITRDDLDRAGLAHPLRVQDCTGALWVLNSKAIERLALDAPCVERDGEGRPTGRIWRGDDWLRRQIGSSPPCLAPLSRRLARFGVTGITDASATNGPEAVALLGQARSRGEIVQQLCVMSAGPIPPSPHYEIGPIKILPDERDLPALEDIVSHMRLARSAGRRVAVHCVTASELVLAMAGFDVVGTTPGDRLEHGGVIPAPLIGDIRALGLTVVTQPHFIYDRGDRYARTHEPEEMLELYRLRNLLDAGVKMAAGSDAPYGGIDPWRAIACATDRKTKSGQILGSGESIGARAALELYLAPIQDPGGEPRRIAVGRRADLCLLEQPLAEALRTPEKAAVAATIVGGDIVYQSN